MKSNPCLQCQLKSQDKNNPLCLHCHKRLDYVCHLERALNFAQVNPEEKPASPRLPTSSAGIHLLAAFTDRY
jgi:hypothetical protein